MISQASVAGTSGSRDKGENARPNSQRGGHVDLEKERLRQELAALRAGK